MNRAKKHAYLVKLEKIRRQAKRSVQHLTAKRWRAPSHTKAINFLIQSQQCDLAADLTEEMNKYPKGSPERALLKAVRFGIAYGRPDSTINIHTDYSPEEMMTRFRAIFKPKEDTNDTGL